MNEFYCRTCSASTLKHRTKSGKEWPDFCCIEANNCILRLNIGGAIYIFLIKIFQWIKTRNIYYIIILLLMLKLKGWIFSTPMPHLLNLKQSSPFNYLYAYIYIFSIDCSFLISSLSSWWFQLSLSFISLQEWKMNLFNYI